MSDEMVETAEMSSANYYACTWKVTVEMDGGCVEDIS